MITKEVLETKRSPKDLRAFVQKTFDSIQSNPGERKIARLKKSYYKELIEEIYPFSIFCELKYSDAQVLCQPIIGSQGYDAIIENINGELVENIELSWPIDGQKDHFEALELNEKGHTKLEIRDVNDSSPREQAVERILVKAKNKALKDYSTSQGSSLIFILDIAPYFGMKRIEHPKELEILKQKLKEISYKAKNVYLLLMPIQELIELQ